MLLFGNTRLDPRGTLGARIDRSRLGTTTAKALQTTYARRPVARIARFPVVFTDVHLEALNAVTRYGQNQDGVTRRPLIAAPPPSSCQAAAEISTRHTPSTHADPTEPTDNETS